MSTVPQSEFTLLTEFFDGAIEQPDVWANDTIAHLWNGGYRIVRRPAKIDVNIWKDERSPEGYMVLDRRKTVGEVWEEMLAIVGAHGPGHDEYMTITGKLTTSDPWPDGNIVCFAVNGTSEGDYVHVDVTYGERRTPIFLAKTFDGRDAAWAFARELADIFEELA